MSLYQLAYISKSHVEGTDQVIEWELESILDAALRNNPGAGITGALLYSGGYFCQILEGPEAAIRKLFANIALDKRHSEINTLVFEEIGERQFGMWSMAFAGMEAQQRFNVAGIKEDGNAISAKQLGREMIDSLLRLVQKRERPGTSSGPVGVRNPSA